MNPDYVTSEEVRCVPSSPPAIDDGGPAFPQASPEMTLTGQSVTDTQGMSLRDYFAAKAMQGDLAAQDSEHVGVIGPSTSDESLLEMAKLYYRMADQMLIARKQPTE